MSRPAWEHQVLDLTALGDGQREIALDTLGKSAWELVCVSAGAAYLKRQVVLGRPR